MLGLLLMLAWQQPALEVTASADRTRVEVGEELEYSVKVITAVPGSFRVELPTLSGLEVLERTERTDVPGAQGARTYILELRLRAVTVGTWRMSPVLVFVGAETQVAPEVAITVTGGANATTDQLNPRLLGLIQRAPPPTPGGPSVAIVASSSTVYAGDQLDVLTVAWFPRSLRARLRHPPLLKPPVVDGVWSVPRPQIAGIVTTRTIGDESYDLFVNHQIVFPLAPGNVVIPPARLSYGVPAGRSSSGDERTIDRASDSVVVTVSALPSTGRPTVFTGPVARNVQIGYRVRDLPARAGDLLPVELVVSGEGNVTLWTTPAIQWPEGVRAYTDRVEDSPYAVAGRVAGTKTFRFLLLPDSAGSLSLPPLTYPYFDPETGSYREAASNGMVIPVIAAAERMAKREVVALAPADPPWPGALTGAIPFRSFRWMALALGPLVLVLLRTLWAHRRPRPVRRPVDDPLHQFETTVDRLAHLTDPEGRRPLMTALRRVGLDRELSYDVAKTKLEIDAARFGPGVAADPAGRANEFRSLLARIPARLKRLVTIVMLAALIGKTAAGLEAIQRDPLAAYHEQDYITAATGFAEAVRRDSSRWNDWYNLAAADYMHGRDSEAAAALARSLELAPRAAVSRTLWLTLAREHEPLRSATVTEPLSVGEWWVLALAFWWAWGITAWLPRSRILSRIRLVLVLLALGAAAGGVVTRASLARPNGFLRLQTRLLAVPYGLATERAMLPALSRVQLIRRHGEWLLVRDLHGVEGWLMTSGVVPVHDLD